MAFKESDIEPFVVECVPCVLFLDAGSHWMPRFCARLWDRDPAMAKLLPYWEKRKQQRIDVIFLQRQPGNVATLLWSPRWLLLRGWESTCLQSMPHCFSGIGSWHFCKIEGRRERERWLTHEWEVQQMSDLKEKRQYVDNFLFKAKPI